MECVASKVPWEQVCKMLEKVQSSKRDKKKDMLKKFIQQYKSMIAGYPNRNDEGNNTFFPVLRILLPSLDRDRGAYGVKEKKLADLYIRILGLKKDGTDAQKLLNYNKPKTGGGFIGDFAEIAYLVLRNRCPEKGQLSLFDVDKHLTIIADAYTEKGAIKEVENSLLHLLQKMTATEQKWLIRVLMKEMHLGVTEATIFNQWHPDAKEYYDVTNSLLKVCLTLKDYDSRLEEIQVSLFTPFRPMLSERVNLQKIETQMNHKEYFSEVKYDGERSQIHKSGDKYKYFSRNCFDFTNNFGSNPIEGLFTPHVHHLFQSEVQDIILDGEMVVWSSKHKAIIPKSVNLDVKNLKESGDWQACFCAFDLLYLNGEVWTNRPLAQRIHKLHTVIQESEGRVMLTRSTNVRTKEDVINCLNVAIDNREEGIVLKDPDSFYKPASRKSGWIKVKPDYVDSMVPELDLVIVGGFYGTGRKKGVLAKFLLAALSVNENGSKEYHSMTQVASGYTDLQLEKLVTKLSDKFTKHQPANVKITKEKPDLWIPPEKSCVLQVKGAELTKTKHFKTGFTLRFPRVEFIREDKNFDEILTVPELDALYKEAGGKFAAKYGTDGTPPPPRKKRKLDSSKPVVTGQFKPANISGITPKSSAFNKKQFCVIVGGRAKKKHEVEQKIKEFGGDLTQNPGKQTYCVVTDTLSIRVKNLMKTACYNIVKLDWLNECFENGRLLPWSPIDVIFTLPEATDDMMEKYDQFGDSLFEPTDPKRLEKIMSLMDKKDWKTLSPKQMNQLDKQIEGNYGLFRLLTVFVGENLLIGDEKVAIYKLQLHGAKITEELDGNVSHILVSESSTSSDYPQHFEKITSSWVDRCLQRNKL